MCNCLNCETILFNICLEKLNSDFVVNELYSERCLHYSSAKMPWHRACLHEYIRTHKFKILNFKMNSNNVSQLLFVIMFSKTHWAGAGRK